MMMLPMMLIRVLLMMRSELDGRRCCDHDDDERPLEYYPVLLLVIFIFSAFLSHLRSQLHESRSCQAPQLELQLELQEPQPWEAQPRESQP